MRPATARVRAAIVAVCAVATAPLALSTAACGSSTDDAQLPVAALPSTPDAGLEYNALLRQWALGSAEVRQGLDDELAAFVRRHPEDDSSRMVRVLRGFNALERGDERVARAAARVASLGPPGTARDLGSLIVGVAERRAGKHRQALKRLRPLLHKLIDPFATALLDEELVEAALGAKRWREAMDFMAVWLRETEPASRKAVAVRIEKMLVRVSTEQLLTSLAEATEGEQAAADEEMARLITARLAVAAREAKDGALARTLLDAYGGLLGNQGEAVARLAADTSRGRVTARTLGVVLSLRTSELSQRSAEVVQGMAFGLGLPGSGARLVTKEAGTTPTELRAAMQELAASGAAVIVAGIDPSSARAAADFGQLKALPVVLLSEPRDAAGESSSAAQTSGPFIFQLGVTSAQSSGALARALRDDGAERIVGFGWVRPPQAAAADAATVAADSAPGAVAVTSGDPFLNTVAEFPCPARVDAAGLRAVAADAVLVRDGASCGKDVLRKAAQLRARIGIGLGVAAMADRTPPSAWVLSAGAFPAHPKRPPQVLADWMKTGRGVPSWWTALGRDAAVLGWKAVKDLEEVAGDDSAQVRARRGQVATGLAAASSALWTSDGRGFGPARRLPRTITVRQGSASGAGPGSAGGRRGNRPGGAGGAR